MESELGEGAELDVAHFRQRLLALQKELLAADGSGQEAAGVVELDQSRVGRLSRMDAMQGQAMSAETNRRRQQQLREIGDALARIDADEYGWCLQCGEAIDPRRLEFDPAASMCVGCAAKRE